MYAASADTPALIKAIVPCPYKFKELNVNGREYLASRRRFLEWDATPSLTLITGVFDIPLPLGLDHVHLVHSPFVSLTRPIEMLGRMVE